MKKLIGFFVVTLLIETSIFPIVNSEIDHNQIDKNKTNVNLIDISDDCGCGNENEINLIKHQYSIVQGKNKLLNPNYASPKPEVSENLPDYFNWKDVNGNDWTTPAKDQGNCGSCWNFAAMGGLEAIISIRENCSALDPDLSEQYVLSCLPRAGSCKGGQARLAYKYINRTDEYGNYCNGVVLESCMPYQANDDFDCEDKCTDWEDKLIPIVDYGNWIPDGSENDINAIKSQIMNHGPVLAVMLFTYYVHGENNIEEWGWTHHSADDYYPYPGPVENANHQVVLVGWKDDPTIGNGGYWIVKNSCSSEWGYDGFFNIEYGSLNIDSIDITWVEYDPALYNNWAPKVYSGGIYEASINEEINFDGSGTVDPENDITDYVWDFGDGTQKNGEIQTHTYIECGIYPIKLSVIDSNGNIGFDETWAFIECTNSPPFTPVLKGRKIGLKETEYEYTFSAEDPDGDELYYYFNWGDTYWTGSWHPWVGPYESGEIVKLINIWDTIGRYVVRVKAKDKYGAESDWVNLEVTVPKTKNINQFYILLKLIQEFPFLESLL